MPTRRALLYGGLILYLAGQALDTFWHNRFVSFVPEPVGKLLLLHSAIYLSVLVCGLAGVRILFGPVRGRVAGVPVLLGVAVQLIGGVADFVIHARGDYAPAVYHDLVWYGAAGIALGCLLLEILGAHRSAAADPAPAADTPATTDAAATTLE